MYFGLCNSPGTFQQIITSIFQELLHEGTLANYMDDFVILAKTEKELEVSQTSFSHISTNYSTILTVLKPA